MRLSLSVRAGFAALCALFLVLFIPGAAQAAVTGKVDKEDPKLNPAGADVYFKGGESSDTQLIGLRLNDDAKTELRTYCIELDVTARQGAKMTEADWEDYPNSDNNFVAEPEHVLWILHNSYPNKSLTSLAGTVGIEGILGQADAIAGTQAAIWHYSNGAELDPSKNNDFVMALYTYLTGEANVGLDAEPADTLTITPPSNQGEAGGLVGPFAVETTAEEVALTIEGPEGTAIVDKDGNPLETAKNGEEFFVQANDEAGEATINATAESVVKAGRMFRGMDKKPQTQTLIVATDTPVQVDATAKASWEAKPAPGEGGKDILPVTGANVGLLAAGGLSVLGVGVALLLMMQTRRRASNRI